MSYSACVGPREWSVPDVASLHRGLRWLRSTVGGDDVESQAVYQIARRDGDDRPGRAGLDQAVVRAGRGGAPAARQCHDQERRPHHGRSRAGRAAARRRSRPQRPDRSGRPRSRRGRRRSHRRHRHDRDAGFRRYALPHVERARTQLCRRRRLRLFPGEERYIEALHARRFL